MCGCTCVECVDVHVLNVCVCVTVKCVDVHVYVLLLLSPFLLFLVTQTVQDCHTESLMTPYLTLFQVLLIVPGQ